MPLVWSACQQTKLHDTIFVPLRSVMAYFIFCLFVCPSPVRFVRSSLRCTGRRMRRSGTSRTQSELMRRWVTVAANRPSHPALCAERYSPRE